MGCFPTSHPRLGTKRGRLRKMLGKQRLGGHELGLPPKSIPKLVAHLYKPLYAHGPDECTTAEAAEAIGCDKEAILIAHREGKLTLQSAFPFSARWRS